MLVLCKNDGFSWRSSTSQTVSYGQRDGFIVLVTERSFGAHAAYLWLKSGVFKTDDMRRVIVTC